MVDSEHMQKARKIINDNRGKANSPRERGQFAISLAAAMLAEANRIQTTHDKAIQQQISRMMKDPHGKVFTTQLTDQCFRSSSAIRTANQIHYVMNKFGTPQFLPFRKRLEMHFFRLCGDTIAAALVPFIKHRLRKETSNVILPGESDKLAEHMKRRNKEGVRINLNHLGEAILGEGEALKRLETYLTDLKKPEVEYISVKISTICSQLNLLAWEETLAILSERLSQLYRAAASHYYVRGDGTQVPKFVNLDMEEYRDLHLTKELFCRVLDKEEFKKHSAGIVLQSYLPDSFNIQKALTSWAMQRIAQGGAPIKIRIVKGANLAMEQVEASTKGWAQAPYRTKSEVDANYKRMVTFCCKLNHAKAVHLGIASHNLFDLAYGLLLSAEESVERFVTFEMLEGMADHIRKVVQVLAGDILLYCPAATQEEFQNAVAYLTRRLDENTAPENFLRHAFELTQGSDEWNMQVKLFLNACDNIDIAGTDPQRSQDRENPKKNHFITSLFFNEPDTDWALLENRQWIDKAINNWSLNKDFVIPLVIDGEVLAAEKLESKSDPSLPTRQLYRYSLASLEQVERALVAAKRAEEDWSKLSVDERSRLLESIAQVLREQRGDFIAAMMADTAKTIPEADTEFSEAIDFAEYYSKSLQEIGTFEDIQWKPKGTVLIAPPWNFSCSIAAGGVVAALAAGNCVIFKPAPESVLVGWMLAKAFWQAGVSQKVLQFISCEDDPVGTKLIEDDRINTVILTGATATAKRFLIMRPGIDLIAETGGKNAMIVSALSDRDQAIKDLINSAFGFSGQKCSACSLGILEAEVYDDLHFREQLRDAASSLIVGSAWQAKTKVNPLIRAPGETLIRGLTKLDNGEEWLLEPKQDKDNPNLWSPGIKLGVKAGSFSHQSEFFGPVLSLMRAESLNHAIKIANGTPYGLTSGLQSLDEREQSFWLANIVAGNCYINRGITGAIVRRQPFGGCKESSFGRGSKAGGPNYLTQLMVPNQVSDPKENIEVDKTFEGFTHVFDGKALESWRAALASYTYFWKNYFSKDHDPSKVLGEDNILRYLAKDPLTLRLNDSDELFDISLVAAAAQISSAKLMVSCSEKKAAELKAISPLRKLSAVTICPEGEDAFLRRVAGQKIDRVRLLSEPSDFIKAGLSRIPCPMFIEKPLLNGRFELLNYVREVSISNSYHRYGNLGEREHKK